MYIEIFFITVTILFFLTHLFLLKGLTTSLSLKKNLVSPLPKVSVIIAGRNESANIKSLVVSLSALSYPKELLEIILVNDNSTDDTFDQMTESTKEYDFFKVINSDKSPETNLKGKANAIDTAIRKCTGEFIVSTDADCRVPANWVSETIKYFYGSTAMVCGYTMIKHDDSLFAKLQCLDWMYLLTLASSSAGLKMILSCLGNNLSFSKKVYFDIGGYAAIDFSVTEDLALMRRINSYRQYEIKYPVDKDCLIETLPCRDLSELFSQKRRWFRGGIGINFLGYVLGFELYIMNILLVSGLFFLSVKIYIILIVIKIISELILIYRVLDRLELSELLKYYPLYCLYFAFYGLVLPLSFLTGKKIKWKGQKF